MSFILTLASALVLTVLAEWASYALVARRGPADLLLYSLLINSLTNPLLNYLYNYQVHQLWALEASVVMAESLPICLLMETGYKRALMLSLVANAASLGAGLIILG